MEEHERERMDVPDVSAAEAVSLPEPLPVYIKLADGEEKRIIGWACPECMLYHSPAIYACREDDAEKAAREAAVRCCHRSCHYCGVDMGNSPGWVACNACRDEQKEKRAAALVAAAKHIPWAEYHQKAVFCEQLDEFYYDMSVLTEELLDAHMECRLDLTGGLPILWACYVQPLAIDAGDIIYSALESHYEDAHENVTNKDQARLQRMLDKWCRDMDITSYGVDYGTIVDVPDDWQAELLAEVERHRKEMEE
jgi:hypothetical protein